MAGSSWLVNEYADKPTFATSLRCHAASHSLLFSQPSTRYVRAIHDSVRHSGKSMNASEVSAALGALGVSPDDAAEVVRTFPLPDRDPASWAQLERSRDLLSTALARGDVESPPPPSMPAGFELYPVHVILASLDSIRRYHASIGIPNDVSAETLGFVGRAMEEYRAAHGQAGIQLSRWDWLRFSGTLYQVGRLTVIPYRLRMHRAAGPLFWFDDAAAETLGPGYRRGDPALSLHVPANDPLEPAACDASLVRMRTAFSGVYPGEPLRVATCTSWLLDEQLAEYLPERSNILDFQRRFELIDGAREDDAAMLRAVFGADFSESLDALPQRTTLERAVVTHLRSGRHWRMRTGCLRLT
jgi:GNAT-like C-terminal domain/N-acyltransferase N-terminal domain